MKKALPVFIGGALVAAVALVAVIYWRGGDVPSALTALKQTVRQAVTDSGEKPSAAQPPVTKAPVKSAERKAGNESEEAVAPSTSGNAMEKARDEKRKKEAAEARSPSSPAGMSGTAAGGSPAEEKKAADAGKVPESRKEQAGSLGTEKKAAAPAPTFDIVRVEKDGGTVVAGRAAPRARVQVLLDGKVLGEITADERGEWVFVPDAPLPAGPHEMAIRVLQGERALMSRQTVTLAVPERKDNGALVVLAEPDKPSRVLQKPRKVAGTSTEAAAPAETARQAAAMNGKKPDEAASSAKPAASVPQKATKAEALKKAATAASAGGMRLVLQTVDYDEKGDIFFTGRAKPGQRVRLYVDNRHLGDAVADAEGNWSWKGTRRIEPGVHRLRVDRVRADGKVLERIELPFMRAEAAQVAALKAQAVQEEQEAAAAPTTTGGAVTEAVPPEATSAQETAPQQPRAAKVVDAEGAAASAMAGKVLHPSRVIIQPGDNLWTIARHIYGRGIQSTIIYEANRDQIRDPDLIYPGQVFATPKAER